RTRRLNDEAKEPKSMDCDNSIHDLTKSVKGKGHSERLAFSLLGRLLKSRPLAGARGSEKVTAGFHQFSEGDCEGGVMAIGRAETESRARFWLRILDSRDRSRRSVFLPTPGVARALRKPAGLPPH